MNITNTTMNAEELNHLLNKYYRGTGNEEEENILREYFRGDDILPGFEAEKEVFSFYNSSRNVPEPDADFENRILAAVDASISERAGKGRIRLLYPFIGAAASILLLFGSYFFLMNKSQPEDTFSDPALAYAETRKVLFEVSSKMNRATSSLEPVGKMNKMKKKSFSSLNKSTSIIIKNLKSLENLESKSDSEVKNN